MINKNECLILLAEMPQEDPEVAQYMKRLIASKDTPIDIIRYINSKRQLDLTRFYENLRKNYNTKKSILYKNIVKENLDPNKVLTTLGALNLQVLLFADKAQDRIMFLKSARAKEINLVLAKYCTDYDLTNCLRLLQVIKADLKICEEITHNA